MTRTKRNLAIAVLVTASVLGYRSVTATVSSEDDGSIMATNFTGIPDEDFVVYATYDPPFVLQRPGMKTRQLPPRDFLDAHNRGKYGYAVALMNIILGANNRTFALDTSLANSESICIEVLNKAPGTTIGIAAVPRASAGSQGFGGGNACNHGALRRIPMYETGIVMMTADVAKHSSWLKSPLTLYFLALCQPSSINALCAIFLATVFVSHVMWFFERAPDKDKMQKPQNWLVEHVRVQPIKVFESPRMFETERISPEGIAGKNSDSEMCPSMTRTSSSLRTQQGTSNDLDSLRGHSGAYLPTAYASGIGEASWWASTSLVGQPQWHPTTFTGKLLGLAWGFFSILIIVYFTGVVSATMTNGANQYSTAISGLLDITKETKVAVLDKVQNVSDVILASHPIPEVPTIPCRTAEECALLLEEGDADVAMGDFSTFSYYLGTEVAADGSDGRPPYRLIDDIFNEGVLDLVLFINTRWTLNSGAFGDRVYTSVLETMEQLDGKRSYRLATEHYFGSGRALTTQSSKGRHKSASSQLPYNWNLIACTLGFAVFYFSIQSLQLLLVYKQRARRIENDL